MELIDIVPDFNLYEEYWKIYTKSVSLPPQYFGGNSHVERSIIGEGSEIYGQVYNSVIGCDVIVGEGTVVRDSILMNNTVIGGGSSLQKVITAEDVTIGNNVHLGVGDEAPNETDPSIYREGLVVLGEGTSIPDNVNVGKNVMINGAAEPSDFPGGTLQSGRTLVKGGM